MIGLKLLPDCNQTLRRDDFCPDGSAVKTLLTCKERAPALKVCNHCNWGVIELPVLFEHK